MPGTVDGYDGKDGQRELLWYEGRICNGGRRPAERNGQNCLVGLRNFSFGNLGMEPILLIFDAHRPAATCKRTCYRRRRYLLPSHFQNKPPIMPPKRVKRVMTMPINVIFGHLQVRTAHK